MLTVVHDAREANGQQTADRSLLDEDEAAAFGRRDPSGTDYVYLWVDGIHLKVRLEQTKLD